MSDKVCRGLVTEADGTVRPCKNRGNAVMSNGFCRAHQYLAVQDLMKLIDRAQSVLSDLSAEGAASGATKIRQAQMDLDRLRQNLKEARSLCESDMDCSSHLRDMMVTLREVPRNTGMPDTLSKLRAIENNMLQLAGVGSATENQALRTSVDHEWALRQRDATARNIEQIQADLHMCAARAEQKEREYQTQLQALTQELKNSEANRQQAQEVVDSLNKRLDRTQGESKQVNGVYTTTIKQLQEEVAKFKSLYNEMVARELGVGKRIKALTKSEQDLAAAMQEMKLSYEQKLSDISRKYAEHVQTGGVVLSERELALSQEVERLKADLEIAVNELQISIDAGKAVISQQLNHNVPHARVAEELLQVSNQLRQKNEELSRLQAMHDQKVAAFAEAEMRVAKRIDDASERDRAEIQRLSQEMHATEQKLSGVQQEIMNLQTASYELKRQHQNEVSRLQNSLREAKQQLATAQAQAANQRQQMEQQSLNLKNQASAAEMERHFKFTQLKDSLEQEYRIKAKSLQEKADMIRLQLDQERVQMKNAQREMQTNSRALAEQKASLNAYRQAYDEKLAQFSAQKDALNVTLAQAKQQAQQFANVENDYKRRMGILQQTMEVQRTRYEGTIKSLTDKLNAAISARNQVAINLEKCGAAREGLVAQVNNMTEENRRLQDQYLQMKSRMDMTRAQYESHLSKIQVENDKLQEESRKHAQQLADASMAHEHVKRMRDEAQQLRANLEENIRQAKGSQQALQRLLQDRELEKQTVARLERALQECSAQKQQNEQILGMANQDLRELKRMNREASSAVQQVSSQYQQALDQRDAQMTKEQLTAKVQEDALRRQLADIQQRNRAQEQKLGQLSAARNSLLTTIADNEQQRQDQVDALIRAQKLAGEIESRGTGMSYLLQQ